MSDPFTDLVALYRGRVDAAKQRKDRAGRELKAAEADLELAEVDLRRLLESIEKVRVGSPLTRRARRERVRLPQPSIVERVDEILSTADRPLAVREIYEVMKTDPYKDPTSANSVSASMSNARKSYPHWVRIGEGASTRYGSKKNPRANVAAAIKEWERATRQDDAA